jgi:hypothetical protein
MEWLDHHPIVSPADVTFLCMKVSKEKELAQNSIDKYGNESELLNRAWTGQVPYLQLIHALVDDDVAKHAFLHRYDAASG